ncbi:Respiration factor [Lachnellula suecica]|uniref:Respiration factor n=1 Tax=Lachnellula suecica TaxID=602035 RepID=A0A8T9CI96_9HELO|nr:Respiration factor [Lachnellula suecica]
MLSESTNLQHQPLTMPAATSSSTAAATVAMNQESVAPGNSKAANNFPPPKTDKPRPHVCGTCQRSFARLEHLKRHERSHTKEKPFECPECARCFARRDLLLRHQQKLHMTTTPSSRPRNRRESAASSTAGPGRVRKGSVANGHGAATMRPRANTISHVDGAHMQLMAAANVNVARNGMNNTHSRHPSLVGLPMQNDYQFGGMSSAMGHRGMNHGLPKLETHGFNNVDFGGGLRTAPVHGGFHHADIDFEGLLFGPGSTINPNALHYSDSPQSMVIDSASPYQQAFPDMSASQTLDENFDWMNGFDHQMSFHDTNENAIDGSSPSAISTASQSGISEVMLDGSNNPAASTASMWQQSMMAPPQMTPNPFTLDLGNPGFNDMMNSGPLSPHSIPHKNANDPYFATPPPSMSSLSPSMMPGITTQTYHPPMNLGPETPVSMSGMSSQSLMPIATITDSTRLTLLGALAQCTPFGGRKYSFPATSSPLSPHFPGRSNSVSDGSRGLPSTQDLQRYIGAYIRYFHPHLPFLHIATLSFDVPAYSNDGSHTAGLLGGRGCLILSMAAIGALYELEHAQSKELFESAKKMIQLYLEERRKADVRKADHRKAGVDHGARLPENSVHTPVWLVQAMLLNVVYGHNCGDKIAGDIASTHCAALVSLSRAADLLTPHGVHATNQQPDSGHWGGDEISDDQREWYSWKTMEERKRTLYAVFILSSLLVSAYNHAPALTNSEIMLDLPCEEEFWAADSASSFYAKGGAQMANHNQVTFHDALGELLRTGEKQQQHQAQGSSFGAGMNPQDLPKSDLRPSTFGCLVLINSIHNYIWETRQRHHNRVWTNEETEKMHRHIEPALKAWQAAWASNPNHSLERPNPYGFGPLSADSIPLLDLAYVRLFVNLSRSKEKFWQRDWDGMAEELSRGNEIIQHAEHSPNSNNDSDTSATSSVFVDSPPTSNSSPGFKSSMLPPNGHQMDNATNNNHQMAAQPVSTSKRERHLRKAAFYAADSLSMSDKLGVTFADFTSRELPLQSAMCAFDCAQVLAEWVATVQERVGRYLGILGKDDIDLSQVPGIMLLEEEDCKLLNKVQEVLNSAEIKMNYELAGMGAVAQMNAAQRLPGADNCGYGSKILKVTAYMLDKAAVWPVTHLMARSLETQANHMRARAESSVSQRE